MKVRTIDRTDVAAGILFILFGLFFGAQSLDLDMGMLRRLGPGAFPLVLSGILIFLGLVVIAGAINSGGQDLGAYAWRGMIFILPAPVFFGLTVRGLGFVPAIFVTTIIAGLASLKLRPLMAVVLALAVTIFATLVFSYGLGLPFRRFGPWLEF